MFQVSFPIPSPETRGLISRETESEKLGALELAPSKDEGRS